MNVRQIGWLIGWLPVYASWAADGIGTVKPLQVPRPSSRPAPEFNAPKPPISDAQPLSQQLFVYVKRIKIQGNTVFSETQLAPIIDKYQNRELSADDLRQLRHELTLFYIDQGYINSGAVLPEQTIKNGELSVQIVEGKLTDIDLQGLSHLHEHYLTSRIQKNIENQPLDINKLQTNLQLIQQNRLIERINAELGPGLQPGESVLRAQVKEARPWYMTLGGNNNGVPSVGAERFETWAGHANVLGFGDAFDGHFNISDGQLQYDFSYSIPLTRWDTRFSVAYQRSEADVVEEPFDQLNIFNEMEAFALGISQPIWQTLEDEIKLDVTVEHRRSQSFLLDEPFSFSRGSIDGEGNVSVVRFGQEWLHRTAAQVVAIRSVASWGVDALGSTMHPQGSKLPDSDFFVWLGQIQWIQLLWNSGVEMHWRGDVQIAASSLLSLEQFTLGGRHSVRGYRQNQSVTDSGFSTTLEFRIPIIANGMVKLAPFYDIGRAWNVDWPASKPQVLHSVGIGVLIEPSKQIHAEFYWAHSFRNTQNTSEDLQDDGIHFSVAYSL